MLNSVLIFAAGCVATLLVQHFLRKKKEAPAQRPVALLPAPASKAGQKNDTRTARPVGQKVVSINGMPRPKRGAAPGGGAKVLKFHRPAKKKTG